MNNFFFSQEQYDEYQADLQGDGFSNQFQRASFAYRLENPLRNEANQAAALTRAGKFVVLAAWPAYGPFDEILGEEIAIVKVCDTQEEAKAELARFEDCEDEIRHWIFADQVRQFFPPEAPVVDDECPF